MWDSQTIRWQTFVQDTHTQVNDCENFEYLNIKGSAHYKDIETNVSPQIQDWTMFGSMSILCTDKRIHKNTTHIHIH